MTSHKGRAYLGVQNMRKSFMQGRGVMIDLEANFGRSGRMVSYEDLMEVMRKDKVVVEPGDFVLLRYRLRPDAFGYGQTAGSGEAVRARPVPSMGAMRGCSNG